MHYSLQLRAGEQASRPMMPANLVSWSRRPNCGWAGTGQSGDSGRQEDKGQNQCHLGLEQLIDVIDYLDYVNMYICVECVDASHCLCSSPIMVVPAPGHAENGTLSKKART